MKTDQPTPAFNALYDRHLKYLSLQGLRPKTIDAYARAIRRIGASFDFQIESLTHEQLLDHFSALVKTHSKSTVKLDLYGLRFFYRFVLKRDWVDIPLIKSSRVVRIPDIVSIQEAQLLFSTTRILSYRVFFFTVYSMGLRLSEGLKLEVGDIDGSRMRVHIRNSKGGKDRFVPLPQATYDVLRRFWRVHQHPTLLFPNRKKTLKATRHAPSPLDRGGVQKAMRQVVKDCSFKKTLPCTAYATVLPLI